MPAFISNKNDANGHKIPLYIRLSVDGLHLSDVSINQRNATMADAMFDAER